jgi:hypothetical protein
MNGDHLTPKPLEDETFLIDYQLAKKVTLSAFETDMNSPKPLRRIV